MRNFTYCIVLLLAVTTLQKAVLQFPSSINVPKGGCYNHTIRVDGLTSVLILNVVPEASAADFSVSPKEVVFSPSSPSATISFCATSTTNLASVPIKVSLAGMESPKYDLSTSSLKANIINGATLPTFNTNGVRPLLSSSATTPDMTTSSGSTTFTPTLTGVPMNVGAFNNLVSGTNSLTSSSLNQAMTSAAASAGSLPMMTSTVNPTSTPLIDMTRLNSLLTGTGSVPMMGSPVIGVPFSNSIDAAVASLGGSTMSTPTTTAAPGTGFSTQPMSSTDANNVINGAVAGLASSTVTPVPFSTGTAGTTSFSPGSVQINGVTVSGQGTSSSGNTQINNLIPGLIPQGVSSPVSMGLTAQRTGYIFNKAINQGEMNKFLCFLASASSIPAQSLVNMLGQSCATIGVVPNSAYRYNGMTMYPFRQMIVFNIDPNTAYNYTSLFESRNPNSRLNQAVKSQALNYGINYLDSGMYYGDDNLAALQTSTQAPNAIIQSATNMRDGRVQLLVTSTAPTVLYILMLSPNEARPIASQISSCLNSNNIPVSQFCARVAVMAGESNTLTLTGASNFPYNVYYVSATPYPMRPITNTNVNMITTSILGTNPPTRNPKHEPTLIVALFLTMISLLVL